MRSQAKLHTSDRHEPTAILDAGHVRCRGAAQLADHVPQCWRGQPAGSVPREHAIGREIPGLSPFRRLPPPNRAATRIRVRPASPRPTRAAFETALPPARRTWRDATSNWPNSSASTGACPPAQTPRTMRRPDTRPPGSCRLFPTVRTTVVARPPTRSPSLETPKGRTPARRHRAPARCRPGAPVRQSSADGPRCTGPRTSAAPVDHDRGGRRSTPHSFAPPATTVRPRIAAPTRVACSAPDNQRIESRNHSTLQATPEPAPVPQRRHPTVPSIEPKSVVPSTAPFPALRAGNRYLRNNLQRVKNSTQSN